MSWIISLMLAGAIFSAAQGDSSPFINNNYLKTAAPPLTVKADETERFEQTYPLAANGRVKVSNVNGSITIETWDRPEVKLEYVKTADTRERLAEVQVKIEARADSIRVESIYDNSRRSGRNNGKLEVEYHLIVPRAAALEGIETVNGAITVSGATNLTKTSVVNGTIKASNLRGAADISTVNGTIEADFDSLENASRISLSTVNGRASLTIPSDASATVHADTTGGTINNDFGLPVRKNPGSRQLYGRIGAGSVKIHLSSVNGELSLRRKSDGRALSPATDLSSQKSFDDDTDSVNQTINSAVREAMKQSAQAMQINTNQMTEKIQKSLKDIGRIDINSKELQAQIKQIQASQMEKIAGMREADLFSGSSRFEKKSDSFAVKGTPQVTIDAKNCAVSIRGWDKPEVQYGVTQFSRSRNQTLPEIKVRHTDTEVDIKVGGENDAAENAEDFGEINKTRIEIFIPQKSNLKIIAGGEIRLENVSGELDLNGAGEAVNVRDAGGKLSIETSDGTIRVIGFRGAFDGKTGDGAINLEGDFQSLNARASNGTIVLTLPENTNAVLDADTEIENEGLNLIRENGNLKQWRIGSGSAAIYHINAGDGRVIIRNSNLMKSAQ